MSPATRRSTPRLRVIATFAALLLFSIPAGAWLAGIWEEAHPAQTPLVMAQPMLVADTSRGVLYAFDGASWVTNPSIPPTTPFPAVWEWNGSDWTEKSAPGACCWRHQGSSAVYFPPSDSILVYGDFPGWFAGAWYYRLSDHSWVSAGPFPGSQRGFQAMAYDSDRHVVVLFGGAFIGYQYQGAPPSRVDGDTWEFNGSVWTQRQPAQSPSPRYGHQMAYDAARHRTILFGGRNNSGEFRDTWSYDGTTWSMLADSTATQAAVGVGMAYHPGAGGVVMFGGEMFGGGSASDETWLLPSDAGAWQRLTSDSSPPGRSMFGMAFDAVRQAVVAFGSGYNLVTGVGSYRVDTWQFAGDGDQDGIMDLTDNCPFVSNRDQADRDGDHQGDVCDLDDGVIFVFAAGDDQVTWQAEQGAAAFNLYRGDLAWLRQTGEYTQDPAVVPLAARTCGVSGTSAIDSVSLSPGEGVFFLVTGIFGGTEGDLGTDSQGQLRPNQHPCP